jgi:hypothetical protein
MKELSCNINGNGHQVGLGILNLKILSILMFKWILKTLFQLYFKTTCLK